MKSKDYELLYKMINAGDIVPAFVDYKFQGDYDVYRDICTVKKLGEYDINIGARGICYGSVHPFQKRKGSEIELFIKECKRLNLEFYDY